MRIFIITLLLLSPGAVAQEQSSGLVRHYGFDHSGSLSGVYPVAPTMAITFDRDVAATYATEIGNYTLTVGSTPVKKSDGSYPNTGGLSGAQGNSWKFDGSDDVLSCTDANCGSWASQSGDFSVMCIVTPGSISSTTGLMDKDDAAIEREWQFRQTTDHFRFVVWNAGLSATTIDSAAGSAAVGRRSFVVATYQYIGAGTSEATIYVDGLTPVTDSASVGPPADMAANFYIGEREGYFYSGEIHHCAIWKGTALTAAQIARMRSVWLGLTDSAALNTVSVTSATPPALQMAPGYFVDMPANQWAVGSPATGSGGLYAAGAIDNLAQRSSLETWSTPFAPTGWTLATDSAASDIRQDTTTVVHGSNSTKSVTTSDVGSYTLMYGGGCFTIDPSKDYYLTAWAKGDSSNEHYNLRFQTFSDACSTFIGNISPTGYDDYNVPSTWTKTGGLIPSASIDPTTTNGRIWVQPINAAVSTVYVDAVQLRQASTDTDAFCTSDADATTSCSAVVLSTTHPITMGTWRIEETLRTPYSWAAVDKVPFQLDATSGSNNMVQFEIYNGTFRCLVYTSAGSLKLADATASGNANTDYTISCNHTADGDIFSCFNGTCGTRVTGALTDGVHPDVYIGSSTGGLYSDIWVRDLSFYRRLK